MAETNRNLIENGVITTTQHEKLVAAARKAQAAAYAPYSNFAVGAAVLASDGTIYRGCNVENASFGLTICAERAAICSAVSDGHRDIIAIAVVTSAPSICKPCGACRQVIAEFSRASSPIIIISANAVDEPLTETIVDLLPDTFTLA